LVASTARRGPSQRKIITCWQPRRTAMRDSAAGQRPGSCTAINRSPTTSSNSSEDGREALGITRPRALHLSGHALSPFSALQPEPPQAARAVEGGKNFPPATIVPGGFAKNCHPQLEKIRACRAALPIGKSVAAERWHSSQFGPGPEREVLPQLGPRLAEPATQPLCVWRATRGDLGQPGTE
jgi:hypothetical protein